MPTRLSFPGEVVLARSGKGAPALETPLFISPSIWFLGISFNKPVLTHEPGAGAGLGGAPSQRVRGWDLLGLRWSWTVSAPSCREVGTRNPRGPPPLLVQGRPPCLPPLRAPSPSTRGLGQPLPWREPDPGWLGPGHSGDVGDIQWPALVVSI